MSEQKTNMSVYWAGKCSACCWAKDYTPVTGYWYCGYYDANMAQVQQQHGCTGPKRSYGKLQLPGIKKPDWQQKLKEFNRKYRIQHGHEPFGNLNRALFELLDHYGATAIQDFATSQLKELNRPGRLGPANIKEPT